MKASLGLTRAPTGLDRAVRLNSIDMHIGGRLRARREALELLPAALAARLGVSEARLLDQEAGRRRISAAELFGLARELEIEIRYFFAGLDDGSPAPNQAGA